MDYTDEELMDYADGLLNEEDTIAIGAAIKDDPKLAARVEEFEASFVMAALANQKMVAEAPTFESVQARANAGFFFYLNYLKTRLMVSVISLSITFTGGIAASAAFLAWRTQQAIMSFQASGMALMQPAMIMTRGGKEYSTVPILQPSIVVTRSGKSEIKYSNTPVWYQKGPLIFNFEVLKVLSPKQRFSDYDFKKPRYEMKLGYLTDGQNISIDNDIRLNVRIDAEKFIKAQGHWCLITNSCEKFGKISLNYTESTGAVTKLISERKIAPGELMPLIGWSIGKPMGIDKIAFKLAVSDKVFKKSISYKVK
jgi:hypothetical protein